MTESRVKISELPLCGDMNGIVTIGVDAQRKSVKVPLGEIVGANIRDIEQLADNVSELSHKVAMPEIPYFQGYIYNPILNNPMYLEVDSENQDRITYDVGRKTFLHYSAGRYKDSWDGKENWVDPDTGHPYVNKIYIDLRDGSAYVWTGLSLELVGGQHPVEVEVVDNADLEVCDENGNAILRVVDGHIITEHFDSSNIQAQGGDVTTAVDDNAELSITDAEGNAVMRIVGGHILTERFDSSNVGGGGGTAYVEPEPTRLLHIVVLGQSLAMGYNTGETLFPAITRRALMYRNVRTWDVGGVLGVTKAQYNADQEGYDDQLYEPKRLVELQVPNTGSVWYNSTKSEHESICTGINEALYYGYADTGYSDMPMYTMTTLSGLSGQNIDAFDEAGDTIMRRTLTDIERTVALARERCLGYECVVVWAQGEFNTGGTSDTTIEAYMASLRAVRGIIRDKLDALGLDGEGVKMLSYQTTARTQAGVTSTLAQASMAEPWYRVTYPYYGYKMASDNLHMSALGSRALGNAIGTALLRELNGGFVPLRVVRAVLSGTTVTLRLSGRVVSDAEHQPWDGVSAADRQAVEAHMGFFAYAEGGTTDLVTGTEIVGGCAVRITCSAAPAVVRYGFRQRGQAILGGTIREADAVKGYQGADLYLFMPVQEVSAFETKFDY